MPKYFVAVYAAVVVVALIVAAGTYEFDTGRAAYSQLGAALLNGVPATTLYAGS